MSECFSGDAASAGRLLRRKVLLALTLSSLPPILVLGSVVHRYVQPSLDPTHVGRFYGLQALILLTVLGMIGGAYIMWTIGGALSGMAALLSNDTRIAEIGTQS